ncbi:small ubiquitin-related modifier 2-A-like [Amphiura filiformis]|uniref:small ubiquitin-related modifier 2-A-like n=1 Tax=Amphiura filiformis TaxID=82378 RepID=UPI003B20D166
MSEQGEEKKEIIKPDKDEHINLKVQSQDGSEVVFKIKRQTPLRKLMSAYADKQGLRLAAIRFMFDGTNIGEKDTPDKLEMEDDDVIEVFQQQTGGWRR